MANVCGLVSHIQFLSRGDMMRQPDIEGKI